MFITLSIPNWEKFNPRKDVKNPSWFRLEHSFFENTDFYHFTHSEMLVWIYILSLASKKNSPTVRINCLHAEQVARLKKKDIISALQKLKEIQCVLVDDTPALRECDEDVTDANATRRDETLRDVTRRDGSAQASPDRALNSEIWNAYSQEYEVKYRKAPVRNAKVNSQITQLGKRLGADAPDVVRFYVRHNKSFYVEKCHDFGLCLSDAEALHTQWVRGRAVTKTEAQRVDRTQSNFNAWDLAAKKVGEANG